MRMLLPSVILLACLPIEADALWFEALPLGSKPLGIDPSGSVVVGDIGSPASGFYWTADTGVVGLPLLPNGELPKPAEDASLGGAAIVGEGYRWTAKAGYDLAPLANFIPHAVSADGTAVAGLVTRPQEAFLWQPDSNTVAPLGFSRALDISGDGSTVVGRNSFGPAIRWTASTGAQALPGLPGGNGEATAYGVSFDGSHVVGGSDNGTNLEAFLWTEAAGIAGLGDLPGGDFYSRAMDVSADGSVVVGESITSGTAGFEAFMWDAIHGMRSLQDVLVDLGLKAALDGWQLFSVTAVSADGLTMVGEGNKGGFVANLSQPIDMIPAPSSLALLTLGGLGIAFGRSRSIR